MNFIIDYYFPMYLLSFIIVIFYFVSIIGLQLGPLPFLTKKKKALGEKGFATSIAHRGSREEGLPENTIAAFKDAITAGADVIEFDVWLTSDNQVVIHHDEHLSRMTNNKNNDIIWELSYGNLPDITPPNEEQSFKCSQYNKEDVSQIPTLKQVLQCLPPNVSMIIEFKQNSDILIKEVQKILKEENKKNCTYWFSLDENINKKLRLVDPTIPTITSITGMLKVLLLYYLGILPFIEIDDAVFGITVEEITLEKIRSEKAIKSLPDWIKRLLAIAFRGRPPYAMLAPRLFSHLRKRGIPVWFLGVNDDFDLNLAIDSGATGVLTDRINWLTEKVKKDKKVNPFQQIE